MRYRLQPPEPHDIRDLSVSHKVMGRIKGRLVLRPEPLRLCRRKSFEYRGRVVAGIAGFRVVGSLGGHAATLPAYADGS